MLSGPLSIRKWELRYELPALDAFSRNAALVAAAEDLHGEASSGFAPRAHRLTATVKQRQLYRHSCGVHYYCLWITVSNGRKFRAAWVRDERLVVVTAAWERCRWPLKTKTQRREEDALRRQSRGSQKVIRS